MQIPLTDKDAIILHVGNAQSRARTNEFSEASLWFCIWAALSDTDLNNGDSLFINANWGKVSINYKYSAPKVTQVKLKKINDLWFFMGAKRVVQPMDPYQIHLKEKK